MGIFAKSSIAAYGRAIRETPREVICNQSLFFAALVHSLAGITGSEYSINSHPSSAH
jgi:hypothetical protein